MTTQHNIKQIIHKKNLLVAGPCSVESEEQLMTTATLLAATRRVDILRAGVWKPRTNPGEFEGLGTKCLPLLLKAKEQTGLPTAVEVATPKHVEDALSFDVDVLWIGARTTVSPFSMQTLADALRGTDVPVLVKNPVNPDIKLWIGAIERLNKSGVQTIGLIHRGFSMYGDVEYRNAPVWQIPINMKRLFPGLPLICDPSHICGNTKNLLAVSQKSIDLDYNGLMIESHCRPQQALTDKAQQITPDELLELASRLIRKTSGSAEQTFLKELEHLREQINEIDGQLLNMLVGRMVVAKEIGDLKKRERITVLQSNRYQEILDGALKKGVRSGLSEDFIRSYMDAIHLESIRVQNNL
jgi:chorismate mutase